MVQVLHLEDDIRLREILQVALRAAEPNLELKQYVNSNDAIAYIEQHVHEIDLFILDIRVPGRIDGMEVAKMIRDMKCKAPIILTSAYQPPSPNVLMDLNCEWYPKPWHIFETTRTLAQVARKYHEERKKAQQEERDANVQAKLDKLKQGQVDDEVTKQLKPIPDLDDEATKQLTPLDLSPPDTSPTTDTTEKKDTTDRKDDKPVGRMRPVDIPSAISKDGKTPNATPPQKSDRKTDSSDDKDK